jgi:hypothetical protein
MWKRLWTTRWWVLLLSSFLLVSVTAELVLRFGLELGDPMLYVKHPTIEYLPHPGRYARWGKHIFINRYGMRTREFSERKQDPSELRVLCIGDSILFAGAQTDQGELATHILEGVLTQRLKRPTLVANVSAGSWGPANLSAYIDAYGIFDADIVIVALNTQDPEDIPTFGELDADHPPSRPFSALGEALERRALPLLLARLASTGPAATPDPSQRQAHLVQSARALETIVNTARARGAAVAWVLHERQDELGVSAGPNAQWIAQTAERLHVPLVTTRSELEPALARGVAPYRDELHLTPDGQLYLAVALEHAVHAVLRATPQ